MTDERIELSDREVLPCGCIVGTADVGGQRAFVMEPCALTCEYYVYAMGEIVAQNKPVEFREVD